MEIRNFPEKVLPASNDLILLQDATDNAYKKTTKERLLAGLSSATNYSIATSNLIVEYKFDQGSGQQLVDTSGNNLHGVLGASSNVESSDPRWVSYAGAGLYFASGSSCRVTLPSSFSTMTSFTIEVCYFSYLYNNWSRLIDIGLPGGVLAGNIYLAHSNATSGNLTLGILEGNSTTFISTPRNYPHLQWHYIQASFSNGQGVIYRNLIPQISGTLPTPSVVNRTSNFIGRSQFSGDAYFDGVVSLARIYNKLLTFEERRNNFLASRTYLESKGIILS